MKRILLFVLVFWAVVSCTEPVVSTFGSIGGTVQDAETGAYLSGVSVTINPLGYSQVTNADGTFQYDNLEVSEYTLVYTKTGYETYKHKVTVKPGIVSPVQVSLNPASSSVSASPSILDFGTKTTELQLKITANSGSVPYTLTPSNNWITLSKTSGTVSGDDYVTVVVSRSGLSPASYDGNIIVSAGGKDVSIAVKMTVAASGVPVVTIEAVEDVTASSAVAKGNIKVVGDAQISKYGFCWSSTNASPGLSDENNNLGDASDVKSFNANLNGLSPQTKYYIRAYAVNSFGTSYSDEVLEFITSASSDSGDGGGDTSGSVVVPQGLMSYYTFDDADASDITENELDGTLIENPSFLSETIDGTGKALALNGVKSQYVTIPYNVLKARAKYTVSLWMKDFSQGIVFSAEGGNSLPCLYVTDTQKFMLYNDYYTYVRESEYTFAYDCTSIMSSDWHHIVVSSNDGAMVLYVDGVKVDSLKADYDTSDSSRIIIGGLDHTTSSYMTMKVDNVRFYQRVLSDSEVKEIYNDEK